MLGEYLTPTGGNDHTPSEDILSKLGLEVVKEPGCPSEMEGGVQGTAVAGKGLE